MPAYICPNCSKTVHLLAQSLSYRINTQKTAGYSSKFGSPIRTEQEKNIFLLTLHFFVDSIEQMLI